MQIKSKSIPLSIKTKIHVFTTSTVPITRGGAHYPSPRRGCGGRADSCRPSRAPHGYGRGWGGIGASATADTGRVFAATRKFLLRAFSILFV